MRRNFLIVKAEIRCFAFDKVFNGSKVCVIFFCWMNEIISVSASAVVLVKAIALSGLRPSLIIMSIAIALFLVSSVG